MVFDRLFGKSKQEKKEPFKPPREVVQLRGRIDSEMRENFPNRDRCKELEREAASVYRVLDAAIALKEHEAQAAQVKDEIKGRLAALSEKIQRNISDAAKGKPDYLEKNIDYLERKSMRNQAKSLYAEFLEACDQFHACLSATSPDQCRMISTAAGTLVRTLKNLEEHYFTKHGQDTEIQGLKQGARSKVEALAAVLSFNAMLLDRMGAKPLAERTLKQLQEIVKAQ